MQPFANAADVYNEVYDKLNPVARKYYLANMLAEDRWGPTGYYGLDDWPSRASFENPAYHYASYLDYKTGPYADLVFGKRDITPNEKQRLSMWNRLFHPAKVMRYKKALNTDPRNRQILEAFYQLPYRSTD